MNDVEATCVVPLAGGGDPLPVRCEYPGPPLPPPGEAPADAAGARRAIGLAYDQVWNGTSPLERRLEAIADPRGVRRALERDLAAKAAQHPSVARSSGVQVFEIVFRSPVQAQLHFRLVSPGSPNTARCLGAAAFVDGQWKVLRTTACEVLQEAGAPCAASD